MTKKHFFLKILIALIFFFLPFSVVEATELDKYKKTEIETPYYAPLLFEAYGQKVILKEEIPFSITSVSVNNEIVDITEDNEIYVSKDDAVRITGKAEPKSKTTIYFADKKIEVNTVENGNWLVLFSITNLNDSKYIVSAKNDRLRESTNLFTLVVGNGKKVIQPILNSTTTQTDTFLEKRGEYLAFLFVILVSTTLGWFLGTYSEKRKKSSKSIKTIKLKK